MIPETSPEHYISGIAALNIPSVDGTGDWHMHGVFRANTKKPPLLFIVGEGEPFNSNKIFGNEGIIECSHILDEFKIEHVSEKVYAANHIRAIADLILYFSETGSSLDHLPINDWLNNEEQKRDLYLLINKSESITKNTEIRKWMIKNYT